MDFARSTHPGVQTQLDRLPKASGAGDILTLDRIRELCARLGNPQDRLPPVFHVAGTNGKGSTIAWLRAAIEAGGGTVHAYTSPHLVRFNERIRIAGKLIDDAELAALLEQVIDAGKGLEPSFFEVATAAAFIAFARTPADATLIEVGLGGRLDATNVIDQPEACGIASIGLDHQQHLGDTLAKIAAEKAAIGKRGVPLVSLAQNEDAEAAIVATAERAGARLLLEGRDWTADVTLEPALPGGHQVRNANLAWQMLQAQQALEVRRDAFLAGLRAASWPARFQRLGDGPLTNGIETFVDGAHNGDAAAALAAHLVKTGPMHLVLGILANKNSEEIIRLLQPRALSLTFVPVPDHEHHDPAALAERYGGSSAAGLAEALAALPGPRLIAGSLYLAGEALALNREEPD